MSYKQHSTDMQLRDTKIDELLLGAMEGILNGTERMYVQNTLDQAKSLIQMQKGMAKLLEVANVSNRAIRNYGTKTRKERQQKKRSRRQRR